MGQVSADIYPWDPSRCMGSIRENAEKPQPVPGDIVRIID
jgi:hypothetical protein